MMKPILLFLFLVCLTMQSTAQIDSLGAFRRKNTEFHFCFQKWEDGKKIVISAKKQGGAFLFAIIDTINNNVDTISFITTNPFTESFFTHDVHVNKNICLSVHTYSRSTGSTTYLILHERINKKWEPLLNQSFLDNNQEGFLKTVKIIDINNIMVTTENKTCLYTINLETKQIDTTKQH